MMRTLFPATVALSLMTRATTMADAASPGAPTWDYAGPAGPAAWAQLDPQFATCSTGRLQSPIDIRGAIPAPLPPLEFGYGLISPAIVNNGHTVEVNVPPGHVLKVGERRYELLQFHFHTPSEERIQGQASAMVAHLVHRDSEGDLGVVAVLLQPGEQRSGFDAVFEHLPQRPGETLTVENLSLDLASLLPRTSRYFDYEGSLTTPPCSEGVHWMVLTEAVRVSPRHIKAFRRLYAANARPVQPLNGRPIKVSP